MQRKNVQMESPLLARKSWNNIDENRWSSEQIDLMPFVLSFKLKREVECKMKTNKKVRCIEKLLVSGAGRKKIYNPYSDLAGGAAVPLPGN